MFYKIIIYKNIFIYFFIKIGLGKILFKNYFQSFKNIQFLCKSLNYKIFWKNKILNYYNLYILFNLYINYIGYSFNVIFLLLNFFFKKKKKIVNSFILNVNLNLIKCYSKYFYIN